MKISEILSEILNDENEALKRLLNALHRIDTRIKTLDDITMEYSHGEYSWIIYYKGEYFTSFSSNLMEYEIAKKYGLLKQDM